MSAFFNAVTRVNGVVSPAFIQFFANRIDECVERIIIGAVNHWRDAGWRRYNDHEVNCSVQVYDGAIRANTNPHVHIELESVEITTDVLLGKASAKALARPDLRFSIGPRSYIVECKRLSLRNGLVRLYVIEGMERFRSGYYGRSSIVGAMMGFIIAEDRLVIVDAINRYIIEHTNMYPSERLRTILPPPANPSIAESHHIRTHLDTLDLRHFFIDMATAG